MNGSFGLGLDSSSPALAASSPPAPSLAATSVAGQLSIPSHNPHSSHSHSQQHPAVNGSASSNSSSSSMAAAAAAHFYQQQAAAAAAFEPSAVAAAAAAAAAAASASATAADTTPRYPWMSITGKHLSK